VSQAAEASTEIETFPRIALEMGSPSRAFFASSLRPLCRFPRAPRRRFSFEDTTFEPRVALVAGTLPYRIRCTCRPAADRVVNTIAKADRVSAGQQLPQARLVVSLFIVRLGKVTGA